MKRMNIHDAKTHLSRELAALGPGDVIIICKNNEPVAELRALPKRPLRRRPWGVDHDVFAVPADINAPLPPDELEAWESSGSACVSMPDLVGVTSGAH